MRLQCPSVARKRIRIRKVAPVLDPACGRSHREAISQRHKPPSTTFNHPPLEPHIESTMQSVSFMSRSLQRAVGAVPSAPVLPAIALAAPAASMHAGRIRTPAKPAPDRYDSRVWTPDSVTTAQQHPPSASGSGAAAAAAAAKATGAEAAADASDDSHTHGLSTRPKSRFGHFGLHSLGRSHSHALHSHHTLQLPLAGSSSRTSGHSGIQHK